MHYLLSDSERNKLVDFLQIDLFDISRGEGCSELYMHTYSDVILELNYIISIGKVSRMSGVALCRILNGRRNCF